MTNGRYLGEDLIFIISQPRSGSTLLQRVLAGHPEIQTSAETWLLLHPVYGQKPDKVTVEYRSEWAAIGVRDFLEHYTTDGATVHDDAIRAWAQVMYGSALSRSGKRIFLDKTPRYYFIIPELLRLFPKARFVFLLRNPLAVLASELATYVKGNWTLLSLFRPDLLEAPRLILDGIQAVGSEGVVVRYEEFVSRPEDQTRTLCSALGIEFHEEMLFYANTPAPVGKMNDPVGIHRHSRPSMTSLDKWKTLTDDPQHLLFAQSYLHDLGPDVTNRMGYPYGELHGELHRREIRPRGLFPWRLALKSEDEFTLGERIYLKRYLLTSKHGTTRGTLRFLDEVFSALWTRARRRVPATPRPGLRGDA